MLYPEEVKHGDVVSWRALNGQVRAVAKIARGELFLITDETHNFPLMAIVDGLNDNVEIIAHART